MPRPMRQKIVRTTQRKFTASVAAIIINQKHEILLLDHVLRPITSWGLPGGFLEFGEQPELAVQREIFEETGLELEEVELYSVRTINHHLEVLFLAKPKGVAWVKSREIHNLGWFTVESMPQQMSCIQKRVIKEVLTEMSV